MAEYNSRRSGPEWLRLITECRQSGMPDNVWCEAYFRQVNRNFKFRVKK